MAWPAKLSVTSHCRADVTPQQCEALLRSATDACDVYYQAIQFVVWAGKSAADA